MGMSGDDGRDGDISLELERELFGVNDDAPARRGIAAADSDDDAPGSALESELLAVLGGLGGSAAAKVAKDASRAAPPRAVEPEVAPAEADAADAELEAIDLGDLELSDIDGLRDGEPTLELSVLDGDVENAPERDGELEALFADVMAQTPAAATSIDDDDDDGADFGHDPLTLAEGIPVSDDAVAEYEAGEFNRFEDDVEITNVLALSPAKEATPEPASESLHSIAYEAPVEDVTAAPAGASKPMADPIADAFADLADFDLPKFVGTGAGTRAAMAAADVAAIEQAIESAEISAADLDLSDFDEGASAVEAAGAHAIEETADADIREDDYVVELPVEDYETAEADAYVEAQEAEAQWEQPGTAEYAPVEEPAEALDAYADQEAEEYAVREDEYIPEIQTIEVSERIASTGGLDVPEIEQEQAPLVATGDDFEAEFAESLAEYQQANAAPQPHAGGAIDESTDFEELFNQEFGRSGGLDTAAAGLAVGAAGATVAHGMRARQDDDRAPRGAAAYDPDLDMPIGIPDAHVAAKSGGGRKGFMIAATLGALAVAGVAFAVGNSFFGGESNTTETATVIKADPEPVKIKPEETEQAASPGQQTSVYDQASNSAAEKPAQNALVTTAEEPVELPAPDETPPIARAPADEAPEADVAALDQPAVKSEDRVTPEAADETAPTQAETALITPKRVRTMVVKPDGSLVPSETAPAAEAAPSAETAPALAPATAETPAAETVAVLAPTVEAGEPAPNAPVPTARPDDAPSAAPAVESVEPAAAEPVAAAPVVAEAPAAEPAAPAVAETTEPAAAEPAAAPVRTVKTQTIRPAAAARDTTAGVPVPGERAADQPVNVVGRTGGQNNAANAQTQVATAAPAPAAAETPLAPAATDAPLAPAASGAYTVQIASLPSVEEAQKSFANLSSRYGNLIGGRPMNIQKADIPGKGTFYRIRVTAETKDDAAKLCSRIKANGGGCFISK